MRPQRFIDRVRRRAVQYGAHDEVSSEDRVCERTKRDLFVVPAEDDRYRSFRRAAAERGKRGVRPRRRGVDRAVIEPNSVLFPDEFEPVLDARESRSDVFYLFGISAIARRGYRRHIVLRVVKTGQKDIGQRENGDRFHSLFALNYHSVIKIYRRVAGAADRAQAEAIVAFLQDSPDEVFRAEVGQWFDLKNIADWQLLLLLSNNADGLRKNFFLYKVGDATPYRVAPWDYDHSFGRDGDNEPNMLRDTVDCNRAVLLRRLWQWPEYRSQVARRWQQLRTEGLFTEATLNRMIADNAAQIEAAVKANELLWPVDNDIYYDANHFDAELDIMREFIGRNIERLDILFNRILENEKS